jgi:hypothetical protein
MKKYARWFKPQPRAAIAVAVAVAVVSATTVMTAVITGGVARAQTGPATAGAVTGSRVSLAAVAAIPGTSTAWAVGEDCPKEPEGCTPGNDVILRESGSGWAATPAPSPGGQASLVAVSADSASDAWAVGSYDGGEKNLYLHWNGSAWRQVNGPGNSVLTGVTAISPTEALAVGYQDSTSGVDVTVSLRWNGQSWSKVATPDPSTSENELLGVTATSAGNAWAVGVSLDPQSRTETLVLHWNGSSWSQASAPAIASFGTQLAAVTATSATNAWAVGQFYSAADVDQPLILHWNGTAWTRAALPKAGSKVEMLLGVAATSAGNAWAVGLGPCIGPSVDCPSHTLIMHWNGTAWSVSQSVSVNDSTNQNALAGVAAISASTVWAVGDYFPAAENEPVYALLEHWNGSRWGTQ